MEILVVIFIISIVMTGALSLIIQNSIAQKNNMNSLIVTQLAQEGIELVRKIRDDNWFANNNWNQDIATITATTTFTIHFNPLANEVVINKLISPFLEDDYRLYLDNGFYTHDSFNNESSNFFRLISTDTNGTSTKVNCNIKWKSRGVIREYSLDTVLYNWREEY